MDEMNDRCGETAFVSVARHADLAVDAITLTEGSSMLEK
jgi:hypothetical protein